MKDFKKDDLVLWKSKQNPHPNDMFKVSEISYKNNYAFIEHCPPFDIHNSFKDITFHKIDKLSDLKPYEHPIEKDAVISACGKCRYMLSRIWDNDKPLMMFVMLNPSTADAEQDDPTIRRCIGFAKTLGYGGIFVGNLFSYRCTNPKELTPENSVLNIEQNHYWLKAMESQCEIVVLAWGNAPVITKLKKSIKHPILPYKYNALEHSKLRCLSISKKTGFPEHPLYLKADLIPKKYSMFL